VTFLEYVKIYRKRVGLGKAALCLKSCYSVVVLCYLDVNLVYIGELNRRDQTHAFSSLL